MLYAERISLDRKERTDSIERQDAKLEKRRAEESRSRQVVLVGRAVDRSVSGDVDMFDRPDLGQWLADDRRDAWDELWVTTQDRLSRNDIHFLAFVFKILEWGKTLIVLDDPSLDLRTPEGRLIAHAKALGPAKELTRIRERVKDSHETRRYTRAWHGGVPTFGYITTTELLDGKLRKVLKLDEAMVLVLHEMRRWMVEEKDTFKGVATKLNARKELTAKDRWRLSIGQPIKNGVGEKWSPSSVSKLLTSTALLGQKNHKSVPMFDPDGNPLIVADPVFDSEEWATLQASIIERKRAPYRKYGASPLLGVAFCGVCEGSATHVATFREADDKPRYRYYRCTNQRQEKPCPGVSKKAHEVEEIVERVFLQEVGEVNVATKSWIPGEDHTVELDRVRGAITRLENERDNSPQWDDEDERSYVDRKARLVGRRNELKAKPNRPSGWLYADTGMKYKDAWKAADEQGRRMLLVDAGVRFIINAPDDYDVVVPDDIAIRLQAVSQIA
ncbi:recombinase family protein [Nocardia asteroides]|uniref:recombinase family protein n=1 Tax=Nocardia asteroides TaxID=1824 RepID=UPI00341E3AE9